MAKSLALSPNSPNELNKKRRVRCMVLEIPKELKGKELTAFLVEQRDRLADDICQNPFEIEKFVQDVGL